MLRWPDSRSLVQRLIETDHGRRVLYATPEAASLLSADVRDMVGWDVLGRFAHHCGTFVTSLGVPVTQTSRFLEFVERTQAEIGARSGFCAPVSSLLFIFVGAPGRHHRCSQ